MTGRRIPCGTGAMDVFLDPDIDMETDKSMVHDKHTLQQTANSEKRVRFDDYTAMESNQCVVDFDADDGLFMDDDESGW
jgi:hypothetical protein